MAKPDLTHALHKAGYAVTFDKFQFVTINGAGIAIYYDMILMMLLIAVSYLY